MRGMKRIRLSCGLVLIQLACASASGQSFLSNAQVFDFQPGDVFQSKFQTGALWTVNPPVYRTDTILSRYDSPGLDTVIYTIKRWTLAYSNIPNTPPSISHTLDSLIVTDLADSATQFIGAYLCPPLHDSIGTVAEGCDRTTWFQYPSDTCYFEANGWLSWVIEGCGGPYYTYGWDHIYGSSRLVYFHKGAEPCGSFTDLPSVVPDEGSIPSVVMRLDPSTWQLTVSGAYFERAMVVNAIGQCVGALHYGHSLDMSAWPAGTYVIMGLDEAGRSFRRTVVKF